MIAELVSSAAGGFLGAIAAAGLTNLRRHKVTEGKVPEDVLTDEDRDVVTAEFATHAAAVRRSVSEYADLLADGDGRLRERLRGFEGGAPTWTSSPPNC